MIKHFKRNLAAGAACAVGLGLIVPTAAFATEADTNDAGAQPAVAAPGTVNILHFNDFHGRLQAPSDPDRDDGDPTLRGGTVGFAGTIEQLRAAQGEDATLLLSGGDSIGASLYASASQQDMPSLEVLNALDVAASATGNHEFDRGIDDLQDRVRDTADFPYLAANVTLDGTPIDDGYTLFEDVNGVSVAVIGAVTQETPALVDPSGIEGVAFGDPVEAVNAIAAQLSDGNAANGEAELIIAEYHEGSQATLEINAPQADQAAALTASMTASEAFRSIVEDTAPEVDVIFNGHTHKGYSWLAPAPAGSQQALRPIVQAGQYAENVAQVVAAVDPTTGVATFDVVQNVPRTSDAAVDLIAAFPRVAEVDTITNAALEQAEVIGNEPLGEITADITTAFNGDERDDRGSASTMGALVGNMLRDQLSSDLRGGAEIGITNPGGLRDEFYFAGDTAAENGVVTVGEAAAVLPFANNLWTTTLTGEQLRIVLEQQWQRDADGDVPSRAYLQLGLSDNVRYTYDSTLAEGSRITSIWVDDELVAADASFRVAAPSFLISGGDNFRGFTAGTDARDSGLVDSEAFEAYIESQSPLSPDFARSQLEVVGLPTAPVAPGTDVSFTVNKIDLTSLGTPVSEQLDLYVDETLVGSFDVTDDSATVEFEVPFVTSENRFELRTASGTLVPLSLTTDFAVDRLAGENRYETAVEISQSVYGQGADVVYVASGQVWADALTASPAAANEGGPLLLVREGEAPQVVLDEIARLGAERVVIVGGLPSVNADVEAAIGDIDSVATIDRLGGENRYETSRLVADYAFESAEGAYITTGKRFPDALSAGAAAGHLSWPLVLVNTATEVPAETVAMLEGLGVDRVRVVGSADAVPTSTAGELVNAGFVVARQGGVDRYATSAIVTLSAFDSAPNGAYLANGLLFPDALAGGATAGAEGTPLLITREGCVPQRVLDALTELAPTGITLLGGEPSLSQDVATLAVCS